jgi:hypothetical protein
VLAGVLVLAACGGGGGGSSDQTTTFTVQGKVSNGPLVGNAVQVFGANGGGILGSATTNAAGGFVAEASRTGPYRLRATGGKMNGVDYTGVLEASCATGSGCFVTPYTTVLLRLADEHNFNPGDAAALLATRFGFFADPFLGEVPVEDFDIDAARASISGGEGLDEWVASVSLWAINPEAPPPSGTPGQGTAPPPDQDQPAPPEDPVGPTPAILQPVTSFTLESGDSAVAFFYGTPLPLYYDAAAFHVNTCEMSGPSTAACSQKLISEFNPSTQKFSRNGIESTLETFFTAKPLEFKFGSADIENTSIDMHVIYNRANGVREETALSAAVSRGFGYNQLFVIQVGLGYTFSQPMTDYYLSFVIGPVGEVEEYLASPIEDDPGFQPFHDISRPPAP